MRLGSLADSGAQKRAVAKSVSHHGLVSAYPSHPNNMRADDIMHDSGGEPLHTEGGFAKQ
ncbi:hypothetical protein PSHT_07912 [Puccinia striiformis]|uniref:Uncharacterized protein n=2 Tax=Puccinia striiformis TaxID=27350 RepID=A0A2S4ULE3_9BASI|nr:hypothetical protein PSTT_14698 [Puccinia striiformis]POW12953.1 hypothetical protein PSHT_07912 [Puccinia striiformis]